MKLINRKRKIFAICLLTIIVIDIVSPTVSFALTSGPSQPEFSSFEPVATTNMVDEFSGDFTYNLPVIEVPGPHGSSYPLSLSYHSGASPEEEASWVGYGWTLNPGAINRSTRGFPDDYNGAEVTYHNKMPNNWTASVGASGTPEAYSYDIPISGQVSLRYNNYQGFGYNAGLGVALGNGVVNLGYNVSNGESSFSFNISPGKLIDNMKKKANETDQENTATQEEESEEEENGNTEESAENIEVNSGGNNFKKYSLGGTYSILTYSSVERSVNSVEYVGGSINGSLGISLNPTFLQMGFSANLFGSVAVQAYKDVDHLNSFGYLYSNNAGSEDIMDYYYEKETSYNKRDVFIGIPFTNKDYFSVAGEGLSGGFQFHSKKIGHFKPNKKVSETIIANVGGEIEIGLDYGVGADVGYGVSAITTRAWDENRGGFANRENKDEIYPRFSNDLGGEIAHPSGEQLLQASINGGGVNGAMSFSANLPSNSNKMKQGVVGRSSFIDYNTNAEIDESVSNKNYYARNSLRNDIYNSVLESRSTDSEKVKDGIGEVAIFNENGSRYVYGIPVYSKNEKNLQFGLQNVNDVDDNFYVYGKDSKTKLGEERNTPYATTYLLSEITNPDYIDRTFNGPTKDDLGGYTKFNYVRHYGGQSDGNWYRWRMPYNGLSYNRNSLSDSKDDLGSYSEGLKEVYYTQSIETKTHAAIFITEVRSDSQDAAANAISSTAKGNKTLKRLRRIELYSLRDVTRVNNELVPKQNVTPIKTVHFDYSYELSEGLPNATNGKLTLKRIWFEYEGISHAKISPYKFDYQYSFANYPERYQYILDEVSGLTEAQQNPLYDKFNLDAWGNYQVEGRSRYAEMKKWVNQKYQPTFDPAAWQLKKITLPSGGEIHVQYEQDDYSYVQDQEAHAMVGLFKNPNPNDPLYDYKFYVDTGKDLDITPEDLLTMKRMIHERYIRDGNKLYFKFLYKLINGGTPELSSCNAEYITGFVDVASVDIDASGLYIILTNDVNRVPKKVCLDFVKSQRLGNINTSGNCDASSSGIDPNNDVISILENLANMAKSIAVPGILCQEINYLHSYFRLPLPVSKKGGGIRVKRLMMYDKGLENDPVLYGNEYLYEIEDPLTQSVRSSGVAVNEPIGIREENILTDYIAREKQVWYDRIISGEDKKQSEGPLGESIMPSPSVGYSQVITKNIHSEKSNTGFDIKQFYTAKDHPFTMEMTGIESKTDFLPVPLGLVNIFVNNHWASQGFIFRKNDMHGKPKHEANYSGEYSIDLAKAFIVTEREYVYYQPGESIPMIDDPTEGVKMVNAGKEVELTFADKALVEEQYDGNLEGDGSLGLLIIFPIPILIPQGSVMPSLTHSRMEMHTHAVSKIISYPSILKETISRKDNIEHREVNLAFDKNTGKPVSVRSYDEFIGSYLTQSIPASWHYDNFSQMAAEQGKKIEASMAFTSTNSDLRINFTDGESCLVLPEFTKGDLLKIGDESYYHVKGFDFLTDEVLITPSKINKSEPPSSFSSVTVIKTGNNNRLNEQIGQVTFHSTSPNINLPDASDDTRWIENDFTDDLNNAISNGTEFILNGPYTGMNMTNYITAVPEDCDLDLRNAAIKEASFVYFDKEGSLDLYLLEFKIQCDDNTWITVNPESI